MTRRAGAPGMLWAISDLHIGYEENRALVERTHPESDDDWLLVAGDVAETVADIRRALGTLAERFRRVVWVPGHQLWMQPPEGHGRPAGRRPLLEHLVEMCRELGVTTPEDPYPVWEGAGGPAVVAPLFLLYHYSFSCPRDARPRPKDWEYAQGTGVVCSVRVPAAPLIPHPSREAWCRARVEETERRLAEIPADPPDHPRSTTIRCTWTPTDVLWYPEFAMWCGTSLTADWHRRFPGAHMDGSRYHPAHHLARGGPLRGGVGAGFPPVAQVARLPGQLRRILPSTRTPTARCGPAGAPVIEELLPDTVVAVEAFGHDAAGHLPLYPEEEEIVARAVAKRRREFTVGAVLRPPGHGEARRAPAARADR
ncbi:hypothetical protein STENM36S_08636 [Streptomyces tendae]